MEEIQKNFFIVTHTILKAKYGSTATFSEEDIEQIKSEYSVNIERL